MHSGLQSGGVGTRILLLARVLARKTAFQSAGVWCFYHVVYREVQGGEGGGRGGGAVVRRSRVPTYRLYIRIPITEYSLVDRMVGRRAIPNITLLNLRGVVIRKGTATSSLSKFWYDGHPRAM